MQKIRSISPRYALFRAPTKNRGSDFKKTLQSRARMKGGYILPEIKKDTEQILTDKNIGKEFRKIKKMFAGIEDENKKELVFKIIEEVAFQKVAMKAARQEMIEKGLQTETKNASQKFIKENPAVATYDRYARSYTSNMKQLIELLPPKEKKTVSKLAALRDED